MVPGKGLSCTSIVVILVSLATHVSLLLDAGSGHLLILLHDVEGLLEDLGDEVDGAGSGGLVLLILWAHLLQQ